jgi:hypothetical protein
MERMMEYHRWRTRCDEAKDIFPETRTRPLATRVGIEAKRLMASCNDGRYLRAFADFRNDIIEKVVYGPLYIVKVAMYNRAELGDGGKPMTRMLGNVGRGT